MKEINEIIPDIHQESTSDILQLLMNSKHYNVNKLAMKYISKCMIIAEIRRPEGPPSEPNTHIGKQRKPKNWFSHGYHG